MPDDKSEKKPMWLDRFPMLDEAHLPILESSAAEHEFRKRLPRAEAEAAAHRGYMAERAYDAAAHHLLGLRAAHAAGDDKAAAAHGNAYASALKLADHEPLGHPPEGVLNRIKDARPTVYRFQAHPADQLWAPVEPEAEVTTPGMGSLLERLRTLKSRAAE